MRYRQFGQLEWRSSILGLGTAKLSHAAESIEVIRRAIDLGINYLDLGYPHDLAHQERISAIVREALQNGYRDRIKIALTLPSHLIHENRDFDRYLQNQLKWLAMDRADFCLIGRLNRESWPVLRGLSVPDWSERVIQSGRVGHVGFSFHDHFQVLKTLLAGWDRWAFCQFQFSYMDIDHDPGVSGLRYAAEKGLAVTVSQPLRIGRLARQLPDSSAGVWAEALEQAGLTEWGLRFVWNYPETSTAVRDFETIDDLMRSAMIAEIAEADSLTVQEELLICRMRDVRRGLQRIPCTSCRSCMPCREGIDVPRIFEIYNDVFIYADLDTARTIYREELHQAERCSDCVVCESRCLKKLPVRELLKDAVRLLRG